MKKKTKKISSRSAAIAGPLEKMLKQLGKDAHCQMCGSGVCQHLEPAFDPAGKPKILCRVCRIGSAELLAEKKLKKVHIFMDGGIIQDIQLPPGVEVVVYDYDIESTELDRLEKDGQGDPCIITRWP